MTILNREAFETSRLLDFFSERELVAQTGHDTAWWPKMVVKELVDNSLDAMEQAGGTPPSVSVTVNDDSIVVTDLGPGIPETTLHTTLDYSVRVSTNSKYISPSRGSQGNALKCILALPFVLDGEIGRVDVSTGGKGYEITVKTDPIQQKPVVNLINGKPPKVKNGTSVRVHWPDSSCLQLTDECSEFLPLARGFAILNPHLAVKANVPQGEFKCRPTDPEWTKWLPSDPTSPHWYSSEDLTGLIAACISADRKMNRSRTVREFIAGFAGLSSSRKKKSVLDGLGLFREQLSVLVTADGQLDSAKIKALLDAMCRHSKSIKPEKLGIIGSGHFEKRFGELGCDPETFKYKLAKGEIDGLPYLIEVAFAHAPESDRCQIFSGVNWSPSINGVPFDDLGYDWTLDSLLQEQRCGYGEPVIIAVHLATPKVLWQDRGKSTVSLSGVMADAMIAAVQSVTRAWFRQRKAEERDAGQKLRRRDALRKQDKKLTLIEAFAEMAEEAYMKASGNGQYPPPARQVMYACRTKLQELSGRVFGKSTDQYVTQTIIPNFQLQNPEATKHWDVVYDARGHFIEPHTNREVPLGTLTVRGYVSEFTDFSPPWCQGISLPHISSGNLLTVGPLHRFHSILFVEKEGFLPLFDKIQLKERYDIAVMSTKGNSVVAARQLADFLAGYAKNVLKRPLPLYVLHDFDVAGFTILGTFTKKESRRYSYKNNLEVIDFGLRLEDIKSMDLESEEVVVTQKRETIESNGATQEEIDFLMDGRRTELNHMTSPQMVEWLENKFAEHGVEKVVPDTETLGHAYRNLAARHKLEQIVDDHRREIREEFEPLAVPAEIRNAVENSLRENPALSWTTALDQIVRSKI
jgi:DNA topoisomerase VI subunit B